MAKEVTLTVSECTITAYPADESGAAVAGESVWVGGSPERMTLGRRRDTARTWPSGASRPRTHVLGEKHELVIPKLWRLRKSDRADYDPALGERYILVLTWLDRKARVWARRTYYDCTARDESMESDGLLALLQNQVFDAGWFTRESGTGSTPGALPDTSGLDTQAVLFTEENYLTPGSYLVGLGVWPGPRRLKYAGVICRASEAGETVLQLELDGVLQAGVSLTVPAQAGEARVEAEFDALLSAGVFARWKCVDGPEEEGASRVGLVMNVV